MTAKREVRCVLNRTTTNRTEGSPRGVCFTLRISDAHTHQHIVSIELNENALADMLTSAHTDSVGLASFSPPAQSSTPRIKTETSKDFIPIKPSLTTLVDPALFGDKDTEPCCFCYDETRTFTALPDRGLGEQVACCKACQGGRKRSEVPSRQEWLEALKERRRLSGDE